MTQLAVYVFAPSGGKRKVIVEIIDNLQPNGVYQRKEVLIDAKVKCGRPANPGCFVMTGEAQVV